VTAAEVSNQDWDGEKKQVQWRCDLGCAAVGCNLSGDCEAALELVCMHILLDPVYIKKENIQASNKHPMCWSRLSPCRWMGQVFKYRLVTEVNCSAPVCCWSRSFVCWRWWWSGVAVCLCFWSERAQSLQISCRDGETVEGLWTNSVFSLVISPVGLFGVGSQLIINSILCRLAGWPHKIRVSQSW